MKKLLLFFISVTMLLSSCKKNNDYIFSQSPDTRLNEALAKYQSILTGSENGWKAYITVDHGNGATYAFYFKFSSDNRVKMVSDFDTTSAKTLEDASFRIREQQQPTLIFDTYSYVHVLADPNENNDAVVANVNGGEVGGGLFSDFEFIIDKSQIKNDTLVLEGKVNGSRLTLIRATKPEADVFTGGTWNLVSTEFDKLLTYYKRLSLNGNLYDVRLNTQSHQITFSWLDAGGNIRTHSTGYYNTTTGMLLDYPLQNGTEKIDGLSITDYNPATQTITVASGANSGSVTETILPVKVDIAAPASWMNYVIDNDGYWASWDGFHVNGVDDAYNINSLPGYYFLGYFPKGFLSATADALAPIFYDPSYGLYYDYFNGVTYTYDAVTGIAKFKLKSNSNPAPPTTGPARLTRNQLTITEGYYFVKIDDVTYDMVSAKDGKTWIQWFF